MSRPNLGTCKLHVYGVQNYVTTELKVVHVVRLRFYVDKDLEMTAASKEVLQNAYTQGEFEMAGIVDISEAEEGQRFEVKVGLVGFDEGKSSWQPLAIIWDGAPQFVKSELRKLRIDRGVLSRLRKLYSIGAYFIVKLV